jgi:hypothetical protein
MFSILQAPNSFGDVGTGIVNPGEYDKNGRSPQWTANLRAERDLLRQLVPVISRSALEEPEAMIASATTVHDPHPNRPPIPDDYSIEDANADFFD